MKGVDSSAGSSDDYESGYSRFKEIYSICENLRIVLLKKYGLCTARPVNKYIMKNNVESSCV